MKKLTLIIFLLTFINIHSQEIIDNKYVVRTNQKVHELNGEMLNRDGVPLIIRKISFNNWTVDYGNYTLDSMEIQTVRFTFEILRRDHNYTLMVMYNKEIRKEFKVRTMNYSEYIYLLREGVDKLIYF